MKGVILTHRQQLFVDAYLTTWNATEAARRAGYKGNARGLQTMGSDNLSKPIIQVEIEKRLKASHLSADQVLARLAEMGSANVADLTDEDGRHDLKKIKAKGYLIKKLKTRTYYEGKGDDIQRVEVQEIELYDAQSALVSIGKSKALNLFAGDTNIFVQVVNNFFVVIDEAVEKFVTEDQRGPMLRYLKEKLGN